MSASESPNTLSQTVSLRARAPSLGRRFLCALYEGVLLFGVLFIADYLFDALTQSRNALMFRHVRIAWLFLVLGVYFTWFWSHGGQTLAMKTWHIRLLDRDDRAVSLPRATLRFLLCWMFLVPILWALDLSSIRHGAEVSIALLALVVPPFWMFADADRQYLYDRILGTRLVST